MKIRNVPVGRSQMIAPITAALGAGIVIGWLLQAHGPPLPVDVTEPAAGVEGRPRETAHLAGARRTQAEDASNGSDAARPKEAPSIRDASGVAGNGDALRELRERDLRFPVDGMKADTLKSHFAQSRSGNGGHAHEAVDIVAPRDTPVHAVTDGPIAKLFNSKAGGYTIYQFDGKGRFEYYYAHLERYTNGLREGMKISKGDVIGYVGTSGNAPPGTPHLHFAILELDQQKRWWKGRAIDPYLVFR